MFAELSSRTLKMVNLAEKKIKLDEKQLKHIKLLKIAVSSSKHKTIKRAKGSTKQVEIRRSMAEKVRVTAKAEKN